MRRPAATTKPKPRTAKPASFPAPVGGWIKNTNLATPGARLPDGSRVNGAYQLDNWWPTATGVRMRGGSQLFATVNGGSGSVVQLFSYKNGNNAKLFASTAAAIWDITAGGTIGAAAVSSLANGAWSMVQCTTPGSVFLRGVNGADTPLVFDGTSWGTTPAITGSGLTPTRLSHVWLYAERLFFIEKDTLNAWYLPAASIGGTAVLLPMAGVFKLGGSLLFGATWSIETGNGLQHQCVFVTTEGEAAIYQGTDPSTTSTWNKVGVYRIGKPLGPKAVVAAGGDLAIATNVGFVPLSQAITRDFAALSPIAISYKIETAWNDAVTARGASGWACELWPSKQLVLVTPPPSTSGDLPFVLGANARTGAWGRALSWDARCLALFNERMFFGSVNGTIVECEVTGADQGMPYTGICIPQFDPLKAPASLKTCLMMRAVIRAPAEVIPQLSLQADFKVSLPSAPSDAGLSTNSVWGSALWGSGTWAAPSELQVFEPWQSVGGSGYSVAPAAQITSGSIVSPTVIELVQFDMTYEQGDIGS